MSNEFLWDHPYRTTSGLPEGGGLENPRKKKTEIRTPIVVFNEIPLCEPDTRVKGV